ncbi:MAG: polyprenol monophosphomannose synthase [Anaerolineae bacterium]|nr:polyprenol monophosphomannose synthase [Anaerolineae bacterium]MCA9909085.1 polyprenol monophosphomannose synthase [Anaerolineae bacterium]
MFNTMVVIPTYNEAENLPRLIEALFALPGVPLNVLVVDDNSPDGTGKIAHALAESYPGRIHVLDRTEKAGLGPAYVAGFKEALRRNADYIIQMDADFSHQPAYIPQMIAKLEEGFDLVIASRFTNGGSVDANWGWQRKLLSWFANRIYVRLLLGIPVSDATAGYRIWKRQTLIGLNLDRVRSNGYAFQVEMAYVACRLGFKVTEIPIHFPDRAHGESKMDVRIPLEAAVRVWQMIARHRSLNPRKRRTEMYTVEERTAVVKHV